MQAALFAIMTSTALVIGPTTAPEPVPIQRPSALAPTPAPTPEPAPMPDPAPEPAPTPAPDPAGVPESTPGVPESIPPAEGTTLGRIEGTVTDLEVSGVPIGGATVQILCPCLPE